METGKTFYIPSAPPVCKQPVNLPVPLTQDMDFYLNIVTVINFLTSVINAIVLNACYKKCKDLDICNGKKWQIIKEQVQELSDNEITTTVTKVNLSTNNTHYFSYSALWIFLIVLLSMLTVFIYSY